MSAYTICQYGEKCVSCTIPSGSLFPFNHVLVLLMYQVVKLTFLYD